MKLAALATTAADRVSLPDALTRYGIAALVGRTSRALGEGDPAVTRRFAAEMRDQPIASFVADANAQHYEVPARFFQLVLGPRRKYSCCYYSAPGDTLAEAEEASLARTAESAGLRDGIDILELGCGWGSLSLWMAARYPNSRILAVSNSASQRAFIEGEAAALGLRNLEVQTADINAFDPKRTFDRIVSVEMFEHMANWRALLSRARGWLKPDGRAFVHVFAHRSTPYSFDHGDPADWIARYFFTGGIMPSRTLMYEFPDLFEVECDWWWPGTHYASTARDWLANFDANAQRIRPVLEPTYGQSTDVWMRRWRLFFLATSGLFGYAGGREWGVAHYLLKPRA
jgi:cyclopropane-fatty-acyl-phospholipid synthase